jgi:hypothetical protein
MAPKYKKESGKRLSVTASDGGRELKTFML